ncbi:MAG TPA: hypothetical protein DCX02_08635 [Firmicutes bacterium]|nr:hypothetical protein [Bacillota bacterium]
MREEAKEYGGRPQATVLVYSNLVTRTFPVECASSLAPLTPSQKTLHRIRNRPYEGLPCEEGE